MVSTKVSGEICQHCRKWNIETTECRAKSPGIMGWPKTASDDWCGEWVIRNAVPVSMPFSSRVDTGRVGINFAYVRDFPDDACHWLESVLADTNSVPDTLKPLLQDPIGHRVTDELPIVGIEGRDADSLLQWSARQPGGDNPLLGDDPGMLAYFDTEEEQLANLAVLDSLPEDHVWFSLINHRKPE